MIPQKRTCFYCNQQYKINKFKLIPELYITNSSESFFISVLHQFCSPFLVKPICTKCHIGITKMGSPDNASDLNPLNWFHLFINKSVIQIFVKKTSNLETINWLIGHELITLLINK